MGNCEYGCSHEDIDLPCVNCGHPKKAHNSIHPHHCRGEYDKQGVHVLKPCNCNAFKRVDQNKDVYEHRARDTFGMSNEELGA